MIGLLIPWEKLPAWLLGLIIIMFGIYKFIHAESDTDQQVFSIIMSIAGIITTAYGIRNLLRDAEYHRLDSSSGDKHRQVRGNLKAGPDFSKCDETQLRQALSRIDAGRFPDRVKEIQNRLSEFESVRS